MKGLRLNETESRSHIEVHGAVKAQTPNNPAYGEKPNLGFESLAASINFGRWREGMTISDETYKRIKEAVSKLTTEEKWKLVEQSFGMWLEEMEDLPPEYKKVADDKFWDLIS